MKEIVLDTETTGLSVRDGHRIVEIGCIELDNLIPTKNIFHIYLNNLVHRILCRVIRHEIPVRTEGRSWQACLIVKVPRSSLGGFGMTSVAHGNRLLDPQALHQHGLSLHLGLGRMPNPIHIR